MTMNQSQIFSAMLLLLVFVGTCLSWIALLREVSVMKATSRVLVLSMLGLLTVYLLLLGFVILSKSAFFPHHDRLGIAIFESLPVLMVPAFIVGASIRRKSGTTLATTAVVALVGWAYIVLTATI